VAKGYRPVVRDQQFLLAPNMADWLGEDHLVWFVIDTVGVLDTAGLHSRAARRRDGGARRATAGRAGYDPVMLATLLVYAYAMGQRSSRVIERLCQTDAAYRIVCAGDVPDHTVIARFRQIHAEAFAGLFAQLLRLCREAGLGRLGTVAIDGTKIAANASREANRTSEWIDEHCDSAAGHTAPGHPGTVGDGVLEREVVTLILVQAEQTDAAEDAQFGGDRGDELPPGWNGRHGRAGRIAAAKARLDAAEAASQAERDAAAAARARRDEQALAVAEAGLAAERASNQAKIDSWEQRWEQAITTRGPLPKGRPPLAEPKAVLRAQARVDKARQRVEHPDTAPRRGRAPAATGKADPPAKANITDPDSSLMPTRNGWVQGYNVQICASADQLILAAHVCTNPADIVSYNHMLTATQQAIANLGATEELGTLLFDAGYASEDTLTGDDPPRLIALGKTHSVRQAARDNPAQGPPPPDASPREAMDHRLRTPEGAALYTRRGATVEPAIGNLKKLIDRFSRRGLAAVTAEIHIAATAFNLLKLHRNQTATA
jgi:transposase